MPNFTPDFLLLYVLDFSHLGMIDDLLNVLRLVFRVGLKNGFRFDKLDSILAVNLIDKQVVKLPGFLDPVHEGGNKGKA